MMLLFDGALRELFAARKESDLYRELKDSYRQFLPRYQCSISFPPPTPEFSAARVKANCHLTSQALLHRADYLFRSAITALKEQNVYCLARSIQGHYEATAALGYLCGQIVAHLGGAMSLPAFDQSLCILITETPCESGDTAPQFKSIPDLLEQADHLIAEQVFRGQGYGQSLLRDNYGALSAYAHPNFLFHGAAFRLEQDTHSMRLRDNEPLTDKEFGLIAFITISTLLFVGLYDFFHEKIQVLA